MRSRRHRHNRVFALLVGLTLLVLLEAGLHLAGTAPAYDVTRLGAWRFTANAKGEAIRGPRDGHSFVVSSNADGLRTTLPRDRVPETCRVALLGDSTVFGWGVDDGQTVADAAQATLGSRAELLNAGQPGYTTVMAAALFNEVVAAYKPDVTVLFVPMHDTNLAWVSDLESQRGGTSFAASVRIGLARHSRIYALLRRMITPDTDAPFVVPVRSATGEPVGDSPRVPRVNDAERAEVLAAMRTTAASWGGAVHVGYLPFARDVKRDAPPRVLDDWMLQNAGPAGIVDLRAVGYQQVDFVLADDEGHLSAKGNQLTGEALASRLRQIAGSCAAAL